MQPAHLAVHDTPLHAGAVPFILLHVCALVPCQESIWQAADRIAGAHARQVCPPRLIAATGVFQPLLQAGTGAEGVLKPEEAASGPREGQVSSHLPLIGQHAPHAAALRNVEGLPGRRRERGAT